MLRRPCPRGGAAPEQRALGGGGEAPETQPGESASPLPSGSAEVTSKGHSSDTGGGGLTRELGSEGQRGTAALQALQPSPFLPAPSLRPSLCLALAKSG